MNRMVLAILALSSLAFGLRAEKVDSMTPEERAARNERIREKLKGKTPAELLYMRTGGRVAKPGSGEGKIVFFNAQTLWDSKGDRMQSAPEGLPVRWQAFCVCPVLPHLQQTCKD